MDRIISLLPSTTEIVFALGAADRLVGVSHECDFPPEARRIRPVTSSLIGPDTPSGEIDTLVRAQLEESGTLYTLDMDHVRSLHPDLVLTQQLCTVCAVGYATVHEAFRSLDPSPHIESIEPRTVEEIFASIERVAELLDIPERGRDVVAELRERYRSIEPAPAHHLLFLEWIDPPFCAGHWVPELIERAGGLPLMARSGEHSVGLAWEELESLRFDALVLSCCGFSLEKLIDECSSHQPLRQLLQTRRSIPVILFDGNHFFSRPGPRVVESAALLAQALQRIDPSTVEATILSPYRIVDASRFFALDAITSHDDGKP